MQHEGHAHYITFTCYRRTQRLSSTVCKELFEQTLERVRRWYGWLVFGYVVMPEHVHLLAAPVLRLQCMESAEVSREIAPARVADAPR